MPRFWGYHSKLKHKPKHTLKHDPRRSAKQSPLPPPTIQNMPLQRQFARAEIEKRNETCYILTIYFSFFWLVEYKEVSVYATLQQAKDALLVERARDHILIREANEAKESRL